MLIFDDIRQFSTGKAKANELMINTEVDTPVQIMTKLELLDTLNSMTVSEQLEILEITSKLIRSRLSDARQNPIPDRVAGTASERTDLENAAEKMRSYYVEGSDLTAFTDLNSEDFYEYAEYA